MSGFTKLDSSLTASSIWNEPDSTRIVWVTMLSMADKDGNVKASIVGLAHLARKTLSETQQALAVLLAPDQHSGRKELDGRRITEIDGGWHLVTHAFYRESGMSEDTKKYWREKKQAQRASKASKTVKDSPKKSRSLASASGNVSASACTQKEVEDFCESVGLPRSDGEAMFLHWQEKGPAKIKDWKATIRKWKSFGYMPSQKNGTSSGGAPRPRNLSFDERKRKIGKLRQERNDLFRLKQDEHRDFTADETEEYRKLTQELKTLEAE